ncbi:MAG: hypothetical protein C4346_19335, partial [Chloroflexota bacterium]
ATPLTDALAQAVFEAMMTAIRMGQALTPGGGGEREIVLRLDSTAVARATLPALLREAERQGVELIVRPGMR